MEIDEKHVGKMETQLKQWGSQIDDLVLKAEEAGGEAKTEYRKHIGELKAKHQAAKSKLDELKTTGTEKLETIKTGFEGAWHELEVAFQKLTNRQ